MNLAIIQGNLGRDPETRYMTNGGMIVSFSIATSEKRKDQVYTDWHNITVFGKLAELCNQYLKKGRSVLIQGKIRTDSWEKDGVKQYKTYIIADVVKFLGSDKPSSDKPATMEQLQNEFGALAESMDDIPF
jgi:single-strand DNA-binding protein